MDNLELMKQMDDESVDLIYCDILYNTGKKFKDYDDKLGTPQQATEWYKPRLTEMYRILKPTGSIYLQMDYRLVHYIKVEMDNIFGFDNFKNHIKWKRQPPRGAKATGEQFARNTDDILYYSKSNNYTWNALHKSYDAKFLKRFKPNKDGRLFIDCPLGDYSEESIGKFEKEGKIYITKTGKKRLIRYLDEQKGEAISEIWDDVYEVNSQAKERVGYDTQKPMSLLERIVKASSNEGDVVADFFCGSGSSLVVAKELDRQYVGCDISEKAIEITNTRLNEVQIT